MLGTCLTCLSKDNLIVMGKKDWEILDFILNPVIKIYPNIKNPQAKLCTNCQLSMQFVEKFRISAVNNFKKLMNVWDNRKSSNIMLEDQIEPKASVIMQSQMQQDSARNFFYNNKEQLKPEVPVTSSYLEVPPAEIGSPKDKIVKREKTDYHSEDKKAFEFSKASVVILKIEEGDANIKETDDQKTETTIEEERKCTEKNIPSFGAGKKHETKIRKPERYQCRHCDKSYTSTKERTRHEETQHGNLPPETCTVCNKTVKNRWALKRHTLRHKATVYCETCDKWYDKIAMYHHLRNSKRHAKPEDLASRVCCTICNRSLRQRSLHNHMKSHTDEMVYCQPCDKLFPYTFYRNHLANNLNHISKDDYRYICDLCGNKFANKTVIARHIKVIHLNLKPYKCSLCKEEFDHRNKVRNHVRIVHEQRPRLREHICEVCGCGKPTASSLKTHMVVHSGERPYRCSKCDATFGHNSALYLHNKYVHEKTLPAWKLRKKIVDNK